MMKYEWNDLKHLCIERPAGSFGGKHLCDYIEAKMRGFEVSFERKQFHYEVRATERAEIIVGTKRIPARGYPCTRDTGDSGIDGKLIYIPRISEASQQEIKQTVIMTEGPLSSQCLDRLSAGRAAGVIVYEDFQNVSPESRPNQMPRSDKISAVKISGFDAVDLVQSHLENVRLFHLTKVIPCVSENLYAVLPGRDHSREVVFCAHYDTIPQSPGAMDNFSGTLALLGLLDELRKMMWDTDIRFCWFGGEESGYAGSRSFLQKRKETDPRILFVVNLDSVDCVLGWDELYYNCYNPGLIQKLNLPSRGLRVSSQIYGGDNIPFWEKGIDTLTFSRGGILSRTRMHTPDDTLEKMGISEESLQAVVNRILCTVSPLLSDGHKD